MVASHDGSASCNPSRELVDGKPTGLVPIDRCQVRHYEEFCWNFTINLVDRNLTRETYFAELFVQTMYSTSSLYGLRKA